MPETITVKIAQDQDDSSWYIRDCSLIGLSGRAGSLEELVDGLPDQLITTLQKHGRDDDAELSPFAIELWTETNLGDISIWVEAGRARPHGSV